MTINEISTTCGLNFSIQLYAFLTQEEPVYLQTNFHYVYYLKYTELKDFHEHQVLEPKPVH